MSPMSPRVSAGSLCPVTLFLLGSPPYLPLTVGNQVTLTSGQSEQRLISHYKNLNSSHCSTLIIAKAIPSACYLTVDLHPIIYPRSI